MSTPSIRNPQFADNRWYSAEADRLEQEVQKFVDDAASDLPLNNLVGLVAPHAGYYFSGHVAGASFAPLQNYSFETVVLLGPDHQGAAPGHISTPEVDAWRTPLGDVPVAWEALEKVQDKIDLTLLNRDNEHSLEIELPFLQLTLGQFRLVPLMMGRQSESICRRLAAALVEALAATETGPTLFVASSDLSHYFNDETARRLDEETLERVLALDAPGLIERAEAGRREGKPYACGAGPIAVVIQASQALGANQAQLLKYATSADVHPRTDRVVGYAAVALG